MGYNILINLSLSNYYNYYLSSKLCHVNSIKGQNTLKICMTLHLRKTRVKETFYHKKYFGTFITFRLLFYVFFSFFFFGCEACGSYTPWSGIEPAPPVWEVFFTTGMASKFQGVWLDLTYAWYSVFKLLLFPLKLLNKPFLKLKTQKFRLGSFLLMLFLSKDFSK